MIRKSPLVAVALLAGLTHPALAQDAPPPAAPPAPPSGDEPGPGPGPGVTVVQVPGAQPGPVVVPGYPAPGTDLDSHLPQGSRTTTDTSRSTDGFDFSTEGKGPASVKGSPTGSFVVEGQFVPDAHTVRRGDTLWDISGRYYQNPYGWPRVWAYNPQIQNPHWIYPGDRVRLREGGGPGGPGGGGFGFGGRRTLVPPGTVFLRDVGWVDDPKEERWGEIVGAPDDQMLLSEGDDIYIQLEDNRSVTLGQELTIWQPLEAWRSDGGSGKLVAIRGTARIERHNPKTHMVRAKLVESLDVIERGANVGPVGRRFDVVQPVPNDRDIEARILASIYPYQLFGQHHVVFLDKGEADGVKPGNRFFAVRRGDRWRETLDTAGQMALKRPRVEDPRPSRVDDMPDEDDPELYPDETYAELRVVRVKEHTSTAIVTASIHEVERSARLIARKGY